MKMEVTYRAVRGHDLFELNSAICHLDFHFEKKYLKAIGSNGMQTRLGERLNRVYPSPLDGNTLKMAKIYVRERETAAWPLKMEIWYGCVEESESLEVNDQADHIVIHFEKKFIKAIDSDGWQISLGKNSNNADFLPPEGGALKLTRIYIHDPQSARDVVSRIIAGIYE